MAHGLSKLLENRRTIQLLKNHDVREELWSSAAGIYPGTVVTPVVDAIHGRGCTKATALTSPLYIVLENEHYGLTIKDSWGAVEPVQVWIPGSGDVYYARTKAATGIAVGEEVAIDSTSGNEGMVVKAATAGTGIGTAYGAIETVAFTDDAGTSQTFYFVPVQVK